jgi:hypothetical protein
LHAVVAEQETQLPLPSQTWLVPQGVPGATPVRLLHTETPVEQSEVPALQMLPGGLHATPALQAPHRPPWQTSPEPHGVPSVAEPLGVQTAVPDEQSM